MKSSTKEALNRFYEKLDAASKKKTKRNRYPEKEVQDACVTWLVAQGFAGQVYSAKATYDPRRGVYRQQSMKAGTVDWQGSDVEGRFIAIEFKSPGRLSTFNQKKNYRQREYLIAKINNNCFGVVTDSLARLILIYETWRELLTSSKDEARVYLLKNLP